MTTVKKIDLDELRRQQEKALSQGNVTCNALLKNIKAKRGDLDSIHQLLQDIEPELVYRFYHQSFKVFWFKDALKHAKEVFLQLAPDGCKLNSWFTEIVDAGLIAEFSDATTNANWLAETRPILEALWHCKFFVEQMLSAAGTLDSSPMSLPYDWAAVLYLYNLR